MRAVITSKVKIALDTLEFRARCWAVSPVIALLLSLSTNILLEVFHAAVYPLSSCYIRQLILHNTCQAFLIYWVWCFIGFAVIYIRRVLGFLLNTSLLVRHAVRVPAVNSSVGLFYKLLCYGMRAIVLHHTAVG